MSSTSYNTKENSKENREKLYEKIQETWRGLSSEDIRLYHGDRDLFFVKLKQTASVLEENAQEKLWRLEKQCGCDFTAIA